MKILAIDLGTQSIKSGVVNEKGELLKISQKKQNILTPKPGWAQQKPSIWWKLVQEAILNLTKSPEIDEKSLEGICCCGQMHGPVGINNKGEITTKWTQIWMDKRCSNICKEIREEYDEAELSNITGNPITTGWPGIKVRWIKENQRDIYDNTKHFLVPKDFINFKLTGVFNTDHSEASGTYLYDAKSESYSSRLAEILKVDLNKFAPVSESYRIIGEIKDSVSKTLNLPRNLPVFAGGGDFIVSLLGLGLTDRYTAVDMTGTSTLFVVQNKKPIFNPVIQNLKHVIAGWIPFTMLDCGGLSMKWLKDLAESFGAENISYEKIISLARRVEIGAQNLLFYPYMLGERHPENIDAKGSFYGIKLEHKAGNFFRSVMEGVACAIKKDAQIFKKIGVDLKKVLCIGGATRNKLLYEIKSNVLNLPHSIIKQPEASLQGCGLLAAYGLGIVRNIKNLKVKDQQFYNINPKKSIVEKYNLIFNKFIKMYENLAGYWNSTA